VEATFSVRDDGQVDAHLGDEWPIFTEALNDSISSLPPRGASGNGPSTYWIDVATAGVQRAFQKGANRPFTWGNSTLLRVIDGAVVASQDYADEGDPGESMPVSDFLAILEQWRDRVIESAATARLLFQRRIAAIPSHRSWT